VTQALKVTAAVCAGQRGCGAVAPWPPLLRVPAHRVLASSSGVDSEAAAPSARGMAAARLLATDGPVPATKLSPRAPSGALPAPSVSPAAAEPAEKPRSASIVGQRGFSQCPLWLAGQLEQRKHSSWSFETPFDGLLLP